MMSRHKPIHLSVDTSTPNAFNREKSYSPVYRRPRHDKSAIPRQEKQQTTQQHVQKHSYYFHSVAKSIPPSKQSTVNIQEMLQHLQNGNIQNAEGVILKLEKEIQQKDRELAQQDIRLELMEEQLVAALSEVRLSRTQCPHRAGHDRKVMKENQKLHQEVKELQGQIDRLNQELDAWTQELDILEYQRVSLEYQGLLGISTTVKLKTKPSSYYD